MSNNLRGGTQVWLNTVVGAAGTSAGATVGSAPNVAVMIKNTGATSTDITIQAGAVATPQSGGNVDYTAIDWYDYDQGETGASTVTVAAGAKKAFDLSPFAPAYIRLSSSAATTLSALVVSNG